MLCRLPTVLFLSRMLQAAASLWQDTPESTCEDKKIWYPELCMRRWKWHLKGKVLWHWGDLLSLRPCLLTTLDSSWVRHYGMWMKFNVYKDVSIVFLVLMFIYSVYGCRKKFKYEVKWKCWDKGRQCGVDSSQAGEERTFSQEQSSKG